MLDIARFMQDGVGVKVTKNIYTEVLSTPYWSGSTLTQNISTQGKLVKALYIANGLPNSNNTNYHGSKLFLYNPDSTLVLKSAFENVSVATAIYDMGNDIITLTRPFSNGETMYVSYVLYYEAQ